MAKSSREVWAKRVERWKDSGLTAREFASETGINAHTLSHWSWKLRRSDDDTPRMRCPRPEAKSPARKSATSTRDGSSEDGRTLEFVDVSSMIGPTEQRFEIELKGLRVFVPPQLEADALRRLIGVLEQAR